MANVIDATAPVSITIVGQGFATLESIITAPPGPVATGTQVTVRAGVRNTGAADMIFVRLFANGVVFYQTQQSLAAGEFHYFEYPYTINQNTTFSCECGHIVGSTDVIDHPQTADPTWTVELAALAEAAFFGTPTYTPGQHVEPGTPVTIGYQVENIGGPGMLWGGLYDYATPNPNLIGGYWEQDVSPGSPVNKSVTVTVNENLNAQILCGHFE